MPNNKIPARLLPAVYQGRRPLGGPNTTTRHSMLKDIEKIIPEVDNKGSFSSWAYIAHDKLAWSILANFLFPSTSSKSKTPRTLPQVPTSPLPSLSSFQTYSPNLKILFRILNFNPTTILREVRRSHYLIARKYHPDKWNEEISKVESEKRFKSISNAFEDINMANCLA